MKALLLLLLCSPVSAQWRPVATSSGTDRAVQENFRRASVASSQKINKFGDVIIGTMTFKKGIILSDGGVLSSTTPFAGLSSTQTFTGANTFEGIASGIGLLNPGDFKWKLSQSSTCGTGWLRADGTS